MAEEDSDLERTEPASPRRLEEARSKGNVPRSRELGTFAVLMAGAISLVILGPQFANGLMALMQHWFTFTQATLQDPMLMWRGFIDSSIAILFLLSPLFLVLIIAALAAPISIGGWMISPNALAPNFGRVNPLKGIVRVISWTGIVEMVKAVLKSLVIGSLAFWVIWIKQDEILSLSKEEVTGGIPHFLDLLGWSFIWFCATMLLIVAIDVPFQLWDYHRKLRMTKEEVRKEMRESEGDPHIKGRIRALQREAARKRMMAEVPKADVIVTNPTHYAVALIYKAELMSAPKVVAKAVIFWRRESAKLVRNMAFPSCKRLLWHERCINMLNWIRKFLPACLLQLRKFWRIFTNFAAIMRGLESLRSSPRTCRYPKN